MCESCEGVDLNDPEQRGGGVSRRALLVGTGLGLGLGVLGVGLPAAQAATAKNGKWCNPALGYFPNGGHFGAPRGGVSHAGQDVTNSTGTGVYAAAAGTVIRRQWGGGLTGRTGNGIVLSHGSGLYTYYGHLNAYRVSLNQKVAAGQRIGDMGATGNVTGPHLHFETHNGSLGRVVNPVTFMSGRGVDLGGGWPALDSGASGQRVRAIQHLLNQRGYGLEVDGWLGPTSTNAVKRFQSASGLVADGQVGPKTWPKLVYPLQRGAGGNHVKGLQTALNKRSAGLLVDGDFGSVTNTAVRNFQSTNRLTVDGVAGPITWRALVG
ncbi:peptidoglycan-binding protein [Saccharomonospora azurea]